MMNEMTEIETGLFMGGEISSRPSGVDAIMDLEAEREDVLSTKGLRALLWLPLRDEPGAAPGPVWLDNAVQVLTGWRQAGWSVLVHCKAGRSRSGMLVVAYVMKTHGMTRDDALAFVRTRRASCDPNPGFMTSLSRYQNYLNPGTHGQPA